VLCQKLFAPPTLTPLNCTKLPRPHLKNVLVFIIVLLVFQISIDVPKTLRLPQTAHTFDIENFNLIVGELDYRFLSFFVSKVSNLNSLFRLESNVFV